MCRARHAQRRRRRRRGAERGGEGQRGGYSVARERPEQRHCPPASLHALAHKHSAQTAQTAQTTAGQGSVRTPKGRRQRQQRATGRERRRLSMVITQKSLLTLPSLFRAHESPPSLLPLDLFTENGEIGCALYTKRPLPAHVAGISADARQISRRHSQSSDTAVCVLPTGKAKISRTFTNHFITA